MQHSFIVGKHSEIKDEDKMSISNIILRQRKIDNKKKDENYLVFSKNESC